MKRKTSNVVSYVGLGVVSVVLFLWAVGDGAPIGFSSQSYTDPEVLNKTGVTKTPNDQIAEDLEAYQNSNYDLTQEERLFLDQLSDYVFELWEIDDYLFDSLLYMDQTGTYDGWHYGEWNGYLDEIDRIQYYSFELQLPDTDKADQLEALQEIVRDSANTSQSGWREINEALLYQDQERILTGNTILNSRVEQDLGIQALFRLYEYDLEEMYKNTRI